MVTKLPIKANDLIDEILMKITVEFNQVDLRCFYLLFSTQWEGETLSARPPSCISPLKFYHAGVEKSVHHLG